MQQLTMDLRARLADAGLAGSFLVRNLNTGNEVAVEADIEYPIASLAKVPLALAVLEEVRAGRLDGSTRIEIPAGPGRAVAQTGLGRFRHPSLVAIDDLLYLSLAISDNTAADALFDLVSPPEVTQVLRSIGLTGITLRHPMRELTATPIERLPDSERHLAYSLAIGSRTPSRGHAVSQLDISRANVGTARAFADLLEALWRPRRVNESTAGRVRELLGQNLIRHRLAPDFSSDSSSWSSKTGTLMNLRHEAGVVEHDDGEVFAVVALTESAVPAASQPAAEAAMGHVARALHDYLREKTSLHP